MRAAWVPLIAGLLLMGGQPAFADSAPTPAFFAALRQADLRVATIGYRLTTANAALCRTLQPELGMPLHALDQYAPNARAAADAAFAFEEGVAVEAVVPDGPAATAGVKAGDSIVAINGLKQPAKPAVDAKSDASANTRIGVERTLSALSPSAVISLTLRRAGRDVTVAVHPVPGCRTGVEMMLSPIYDADSDGEKIRIGSRFLEDFSDPEVAAVVAHELGHTVLEHRRRLEAAKVSYGLLAEVGRNGRLWRQTEDEADRMSVYLLYNAGYDPLSPVRFWRGKGAKVSAGILRSRTHFGPNTRAASMEKEAANIPQGAARPVIPALLATRDQRLS